MQNNRIKPKTSYWTLAIFLLVILVLVAVAYYFWVTSEKKNSETDQNVSAVNLNQNQNLNANQVSLKIYKNTNYNFRVQYPANLAIKEISTGEGEEKIFSVSFDESASLSVMSENMEGLVRNSISINNEKKAVINGLEATRLEGGNAKDGSAVSIVLIKMNGKLYSLRGQGSVFEPIVDSFELIN